MKKKKSSSISLSLLLIFKTGQYLLFLVSEKSSNRPTIELCPEIKRGLHVSPITGEIQTMQFSLKTYQ